MSELKIVRNGVEAEIVAQYLPDFVADGWVLKNSDEELAKEALAKAEKELAETQSKLDEEDRLSKESNLKSAEDSKGKTAGEADKAKSNHKSK